MMRVYDQKVVGPHHPSGGALRYLQHDQTLSPPLRILYPAQAASESRGACLLLRKETDRSSSIVLAEEVYRAIKERLPFADFVKVMSWPLSREMPARLFRDARILRRAGFDEWVCEMIIRARCSGFLHGISDMEFIAAARSASECFPSETMPPLWDPVGPEVR